MGHNAQNDEIHNIVALSRWLALVLFCLTWTQPINAQENVPGRWHFQEYGKSEACILVGEGFNAFNLTQEVSPHLGMKMQAAHVTAAEELLPELTMIAKEHPEALLVYPDVVLSSYPRPQQLADFAIKAHLPTMHAFRFFVDAGGLMSYGATQSEIYTTAAEQVAKILDGARPSELPLRQAMRFELVINNRTAKALGLTIPPWLLSRADAVIK